MPMLTLVLFTLLSQLPGSSPSTPAPTESEECVPVVPENIHAVVVRVLKAVANGEPVAYATPFWVGVPHSSNMEQISNKTRTNAYLRRAKQQAQYMINKLQKNPKLLATACFLEKKENVLVFLEGEIAPLTLALSWGGTHSQLTLAGLFYAPAANPTPSR